MVVELLRIGRLLQLALAHHGDAVAHRHRLDLVVGDVDRRHAEVALEPADLGAHLHAELGVEVGERLVHQERRRLAHDRAAHRDPLPLAARERLRLALEVRLEIEDARRVEHPLVDLGLGHLVQLEAERDVVVDGEVRVERVALEDHGDVPLARGEVVDHALGDPDLALADLLEAGEHAQRGRLAAPRRSDEDHELAVLDLQVEVLDGPRTVVVDLRDALVRDRSHGRTSSAASLEARAPTAPRWRRHHEPPGLACVRRAASRAWRSYGLRS